MAKLLIPIIIVFGFIYGLFYALRPSAPNDLSRISPQPSAPTATRQQVVGWIPYWDQEDARQSFTQNADKFDYISVFWYRLDSEGNIAAYDSAVEDVSIIQSARQQGVKSLALIANLADYGEGGGWDWQRVDKVIGTRQARQKHIGGLAALVDRHGFDGIDIDYEALKDHQKENFSLFIEELSREMHRKGKTVGVAIHPKTSENNPYEDNGSHAQDLVRLARAADQLYFMTYLEHGTFSQPGPPGSVGWIDNVISYAVDTLKVPREKVFMGIGLMGVAWRMNPDGTLEGDREDMPFAEVLSYAQTNNVRPVWDESSQTPKIDFTNETGHHIIWFENSDSVRARIELADKKGLGGIALWRLGGEDERIWPLLPTAEL